MDLEIAQRIYRYEPDGRLRYIGGRKTYPWRTNPFGYLMHTYKRKSYYAHRIVWLLHHGNWPTVIDHINGNKGDNRIENLRQCSHSQNQYNADKKKSNKSGYKGVVLHACGRYHAKITVDGKVVSLRYHDTPEQAALAYAVAANKFAGEFAKTSPMNNNQENKE